MAQKSLLDYSSAQKKPSITEEPKAVAPQTSGAVPEIEKKEKVKKSRVFPPVAPENLPPSYFVSATYISSFLFKAYLSVYYDRFWAFFSNYILISSCV